VEQTTSSTMPWLAVRGLKGLIPKLNKSESEIAKSIQGGASRLLSMQTVNGGLAYWCGGNEPNLWASTYGGLALVMCRDHGAAVPGDALKRLGDYLDGQLGDLMARNDARSLQEAAAASATLAWLGRGDIGRLGRLYDQRASISVTARSYLALALVKTGGPLASQHAQAVLDGVQAPNEKEPWEWFHHDYRTPLRLFAWIHTNPGHGDCAVLLDKLCAGRNPQGHWSTTFSNAWALNAFAAYADLVEKTPADPVLTLAGLAADRFTLTKSSPAKFFDLRPEGGVPAAFTASLTAAPGARVYASVKLTGQPDLMPLSKAESGLSITRTYQRLAADGKTSPLGEPRVGDLVLVSLALHVPQNVHYVAVDDPLPCTFEAVNSAFKSQAAASPAANARAGAGWRAWSSSHEELRDDRALFFCDYVYGSSYEIRYLARVSGVGEATAPQSKIEAMYEPEKFGLGASERVRTLPRDGAENETASR
jgi:alpha-2-macroglobulin